MGSDHVTCDSNNDNDIESNRIGVQLRLLHHSIYIHKIILIQREVATIFRANADPKQQYIYCHLLTPCVSSIFDRPNSKNYRCMEIFIKNTS